MRIGSNNCLTYLKPSEWWLKIFKWLWKRQEISYDKQYNFYGIRLFDIRLIIDEHNNIFGKNQIYEMLDFFDKKGDVYVQLTLDSSPSDISAERKFKQTCHLFETIYKEIKFYGGYRQCDKASIYTFNWGQKNNTPSIIVNPAEWSKMYRFVSRWLPFLIKRLNRSYIDEYRHILQGFLILDYINRQ